MGVGELSILVSGADPDPTLKDQLTEAFGAEALSEQPRAVMADVLRLVLEWGPSVVTGLSALEAATKIVDRVLAWLKDRPGMTVSIATPNGRVEIENATRDTVIVIVHAELERPAPSKA